VERITCGKLSRLQKLVLVALCEARYAVMKRREFRRAIERLYWGKDNRVTIASLSRAITRLEERRYILRAKGCWRLTDFSHKFGDNGMLVAVIAWAQSPQLYTLLGLKGPPAEALVGTSTPSAEEDGPGIEIDLDG